MSSEIHSFNCFNSFQLSGSAPFSQEILQHIFLTKLMSKEISTSCNILVSAQGPLEFKNSF